MDKQLKMYKIGFAAITKDERIGVYRDVVIVAYSEDQAKKFMRDWMIIRRKQNYIFDGIEKINRTSPEGKKALMFHGKKRKLEEMFIYQNDYIYNGEYHLKED